MSLEDNRRVAHDLFARFSANDIPGVLDLLAEDVTWWIPGKPGQMPVVGPHDKARIGALFQRMASQIPNGMRMTVKGTVAEDDKVAVEVEGYGELRNGRVYNQEYHFLMTFRDGKVADVREYLDTQHVLATWFQA